jgi:hypothetical protein
MKEFHSLTLLKVAKSEVALASQIILGIRKFEAIDVVPLCLCFCTHGGEEKGVHSCPFFAERVQVVRGNQTGIDQEVSPNDQCGFCDGLCSHNQPSYKWNSI